MYLCGQNLQTMKKRYNFEGEWFEADLDDLRRLLAENREYLKNYDRKYSEDFVEGQMDKYARRVSMLEEWIAEWPLEALK